MTPKGFKHSEETKEKLRKALMGNKNGLGNKSNAGRKLPRSHIENIRNSLKGSINYLWKGDKVSHSGMHHWINREFGKANKCENVDCIYPREDYHGKWMLEPKRYEWSNISGKYKRERTDFRQLCPSCHRLYDRGKIRI